MRHYIQTDDKQREVLKKLVLVHGLTTKKASDLLRMSYVNSRAIIAKEKTLIRDGKKLSPVSLVPNPNDSPQTHGERILKAMSNVSVGL